MHRRELGVTVLPEFFQVEGVEQVLDNLARRADVTAIATSPYAMRPVADGDRSREPPIDAGPARFAFSIGRSGEGTTSGSHCAELHP